MAAFIATQRAEHRIPHAAACRALGVSAAWFYKWRHGDTSPRRARRRKLAALVATVFAQHRGTYGAPRIAAELRERGWRVSDNTVAAVMADQCLVARARRRRRGTTRPGRGHWRAPDLVHRDFAAAAPNVRWFGDGTEILTGEGKLYLASVLDVCSRRIIGFALGEHHDAELAYASLAMAVAVRGGDVAGVLLHTDGGGEYPAGAFRAACERMGVVQSMGRPGSALDNAVVEAFHSTLTFELLHLESFATRALARRRVVEWVEHYNHERRHSALGMLSPVGFERAAAPRTTPPAPGGSSVPPSSPVSRPHPAGGPAASLDTGCGRRRANAVGAGQGNDRWSRVRLSEVSTVRGD